MDHEKVRMPHAGEQLLKEKTGMKVGTANNNLSIIDPKIRIYTEEYYLHRLAEERLRAERSRSPLSLIVIDMKPSLGNGNSRLVAKVTKMLHSTTRQTDIKAWYQKDKIAILMPETPEDGALELAKKLSGELKKTLNGKFHVDANYHLKIYTYGGDSTLASFTLLKSELSGEAAEHLSCTDPFQKQCIDLSDTLFADMLSSPSHPLSKQLQRHAKRIIDILGSLIGITLLLPVLLTIGAIIKLTSPGPVLFKQKRNGYRGKQFTFLKFRSMKHSTNDDIHRQHVLNIITESNAADKTWTKLSDDPRITAFGKFLRKTSLDELPQLFNVLNGDMSLVGPRPPIPYEVEKYQLWQWKRILGVKPGITGLWQVEGRSASTFNNMIRLDLAYINNWSLWLDIKILIKTFYVVFSTRGAS